MLGSIFFLFAFWGTNFHGNEFLKIGIGARPVGMGGAYVSLSDDADGIFWNPAGISGISTFEVSVMGMELFNDISIISLCSAIPIKKIGVIGLETLYLETEDVRRDQEGGEIGKFTNNDILIGIGYSMKVKRFRGGIVLKYVHSRLAQYSAQSLYMDMGTTFKLNRLIHIGTSLQNIGFGPKFYSSRDCAPTVLRVGASLTLSFSSYRLILASDVISFSSLEPVLSTGGELYVYSGKESIGAFAIRGGYKSGYHLGEWSGFSFGMGYEAKTGHIKYRIDVVQFDYGFLGNSNRGSVTLQF